MSGPSAVSDPQHPARLLRALSSFREESRFCDAHLVLEGEEIPVQKNILAAASPYISIQEQNVEAAKGARARRAGDSWQRVPAVCAAKPSRLTVSCISTVTVSKVARQTAYPGLCFQ
uniref:Uncharacterized protein n=1 Tax=Melopsittacus undulatus TaxID=13146 RepID=A0A8V5GVE1_MELUD